MAVKSPLGEEELQHYLQLFGLGELKSFRGIAAGTINTIYELRSDRGHYILRMLEGRSLEDARFEMELTPFLTRRRFLVPKMHRMWCAVH